MKLYLIPIIILLVIIPLESFAVSNFSIEIPRDKYVTFDNVYISGTLYAASSDTLTLKVYNGEAKVISKYEIFIAASDLSFEYTMTLAGDDWNEPGLYIILAEIDGEIVSAAFTFDVFQGTILTVNQNATTNEPEIIQTIDTEQLAQQIADLLLPSQQQLDTDEIAQQIADKITITLPLDQQIKPQELDIDKLAQQIAEKISLQQLTVEQIISSQQPIDTEQLAQQIAEKIILPQPQIQQIKPQELDTEQLAQQIADKIILQQAPIEPRPPIEPQQHSGPGPQTVSFVPTQVYQILFIIVIAASVGIIGLVLYLKIFRKKKLKNSPVSLIIKEPIAASVKLTSNDEMSYEKWQIMNPKPEISHVDLWVPVENIGNTDITNVSMKFIQSEHEITKQDILKVNAVPLPDLSADNYYYHSFTVPVKQFTQLDDTPIFVGVSICYDTGNSVNRDIQYSKVIYKITNSSITLV